MAPPDPRLLAQMQQTMSPQAGSPSTPMGSPGASPGLETHTITPEEEGSLYPASQDDYDRLVAWCVRAFNEAEKARRPFEDRWKRFSTLYRMYKERDPNDWRSRVFVPVIFTVVETILPRLVAQLPKFLTLPVGPEDVEPAAQMEELLDWASQNSDLFYELVLATKSGLKYGTGIIKTYWKTQTATARRRVPNMIPQYGQQVQPAMDPETGQPLTDMDGRPITTSYDVEIGQVQQGWTTEQYQYVAYDGPAAEAVDIMNFFPAPEAEEIESARYVIQRVYRPMRYVRQMIERGVFTAPEYGNFSFSELADVSDEPLKARLGDLGMDAGTPDDSLRRPVELLEFWTDDGRVIVLANRKCVLRVAANPFDHGQKPFCRIVDYLQEHMFWGMGECEVQEGLQDAQNAVVNQRIDNVRLVLDRMFLVREDHLIDRGDLKRRPGGVIRVGGQGGKLDESVFPLNIPDVTQSSYEEARELQDMSERASAVNAYTQGQDSPSMNDTATGVSLLQEAGNTRFALKSVLAELMGLKKLARQWGSMLQQFMDEPKRVRILGPAGKVAFAMVTPDSIAGSLDFDIETASSTQTESVRKNQSMSLLQVLSQYLPPVPVMQPVIDPMTGQPQIDPMTGQPAMQPAINPDGTPAMQQNPGVMKLVEDVLTSFGKKDTDAYTGFGQQEDVQNVTGMPQGIPPSGPIPPDAMQGGGNVLPFPAQGPSPEQLAPQPAANPMMPPPM